MSNRHELLNLTDIVREYRYPRRLLEQDIKDGKIPSFAFGTYYPSRTYIPRYAVEARIEELASTAAEATLRGDK